MSPKKGSFLGDLLRPKQHHLSTEEKSKPRKFTTLNALGTPVWTPRSYDKLAKEGYQKNVLVYRCIGLIAKGAASVPWVLKKKTRGGYTVLDNHPILDLLHQPNPARGGAQFVEALLSYLMLDGNAYAELVCDKDGHPAEIHSLRPDRMKITPGPYGVPKSYTYRVNESERHIPVDEQTGQSNLLHLKLFHPLNDWYGMSPLEAAAYAIDQHNAVGSHNLALLQNGGRPSGALIVGNTEVSQALNDDQRANLREELTRVTKGAHNAGRVLVMEGDMRWEEMGLSLKDLDFIEGKNLSAREIAQAFGVPPMLAGIPGDATFANFKEARFHLWEETILPLLDSLTDELNRWLVSLYGPDYTLSYDPEGVPALAHRREAIWQRINEAEFLTINEKRQALGYEPLTNGDTLKEQGDHSK